MADLETMFFIVGLIIGFIVGVVIALLIMLLCFRVEEAKNRRYKRKGDRRYVKTR